jgi:hypothetical protein
LIQGHYPEAQFLDIGRKLNEKTEEFFFHLSFSTTYLIGHDRAGKSILRVWSVLTRRKASEKS